MTDRHMKGHANFLSLFNYYDETECLMHSTPEKKTRPLEFKYLINQMKIKSQSTEEKKIN